MLGRAEVGASRLKGNFLGNRVCAESTKRTSETTPSSGGGEDEKNTGNAVIVDGNYQLPKAGSRALSLLVENSRAQDTHSMSDQYIQAVAKFLGRPHGLLIL